MGKQFSHLKEEHKLFIAEQKLFFVGTAAIEGSVNISPKGLDTLRVLNEHQIVWLNLTGSGNETAAHLAIKNRITLMFCSFVGKPLILRIYGQAKMYHPRDKAFQQYLPLFPDTSGARQIVLVNIDRVQNSCGYAVPLMDYVDQRPILTKWAKSKGEEGIRAYWEEKNQKSIDGFDTDITIN